MCSLVDCAIIVIAHNVMECFQIIYYTQKLPECNAVWSTTSEVPQLLSSVDVSITFYSNSGQPVTALLKEVNRLGVLDLHQTIKACAYMYVYLSVFSRGPFTNFQHSSPPRVFYSHISFDVVTKIVDVVSKSLNFFLGRTLHVCRY